MKDVVRHDAEYVEYVLNTNYLKDLSALKSLELFGSYRDWPIEHILMMSTNAFADIPLEYLGLIGVELVDFERRWVAAISELVNLKRLEMVDTGGFEADDVLCVSRNCAQLSELTVDKNFGIYLTPCNIIEMLQNMKNLKLLKYECAEGFDPYGDDELERVNICEDTCEMGINENIPLEFLTLNMDPIGCVHHLMHGISKLKNLKAQNSPDFYRLKRENFCCLRTIYWR